MIPGLSGLGWLNFLIRSIRRISGMRRLTLFGLALLLAGCNDTGSRLALGTLERDRIALTATVAEVIVALPVAEGTQVTTGTVLVQLDDRQQRAALDRAKAQVAVAEAELLKARNGPRAQDIAAARAQVAGRTADLREAQITYDRNHALLARKAVSQADVDLYLALRDAAAAALDEAKDRLDERLAGTRPEEVASAQAQLQAAQAQHAYEQALLSKLTLVATRDGVLDNLPWNLGERVAVGSPLAILLAGAAPYARVYVPEPDRVKITKGTRLKVHVDGLDRVFEGTVRWISADPAFTPYYALNASDRARLLYLAQVELPEDAAGLPTGVPAQVEMP
jgi:HlyD family secretion protein